MLLFAEEGNSFHPSITLGLISQFRAALAGAARASLGYPGIQTPPRAFSYNKVNAVVVQEV